MGEASTPNPIMATFGRPEPQRRWTVLLRLLLVIPQVVVVCFVSVAVLFVVVYGWFAALVLGRFPEPAARFVVQFLRWQLRVTAYLYLMTDRYPPFHGYDDPSYPVRMAAAPGPLNRLAVLFRVVLTFPMWVLSSLLAGGLGGFSVVTWVLTLVMGRIPEPIFEASAVVLRFVARVDGYFSLVTSEWPWGSFGDRAAPGEMPGFAAPPPAFPPWGQYPSGAPYAAPGPYPIYGPPPVPGPYGPPASPGPIYPPPYGPPPGTGYVPPPYGTPPPYGPPPGPGPIYPPPYGTPPPYGAVPPAGPPPAAALPPPVVRPQEPAVYREAAGWRLVPTSSAKALLVVFLIIGAYLQFTDINTISATHATPSPPASTPVAAATATATAATAGLSPDL
jgi:hypothetical protein